MSVDSDAKLTKHTTAVTVVTAEFANSLYGGEYAGVVAPEDDEFHPSLGGHVHDGQHIDGHAARVSLSPDTSSGRKHVRGQLMHGNLGGFGGTTAAVQAKNVQGYSQSEIDAAIAAGGVNPCIPYMDAAGDFYLDLSMAAGGSDTHVQYNEDGAFGGDSGFVYEYDSGRVIVADNSKVYIDVSDSTYARLGNLHSSVDTLSLESFGSVRVVIDNNGNDYSTLSKSFDIVGPTGANMGVTPQDGSGGQDSGTLLMTVLQSGKVGIGEEDPQGFLTVGATNSGTNPSILIHEESQWGGRISFTNTEGTAGPTGGSYDWTIYGLSSADGSPENAVFNVWYGDNDGSGTGANILKILGDGKVGIGTSPGRALHVQDTSNPPIRINTLTASTGDVMVWDSSTGDVYIDSSIGSDQDLWATFTADDASTATANSTTDNLTIAGDGSSISTAISGDTLTITNASPNVDQNLYSSIGVDSSGGTHSGSPVSPVSSSDTLTLVAGSGIDLVSSDSASVGADTITITATGSGGGGSHMATQWVGAESWVPSKDIYGKFAETIIVNDGSRETGMRALRDNNGGANKYYTTVPIPLSQALTASGVMTGAHATTPGPDSVAGFSASAPLNCRITAYFVMDLSAQVVEPVFRVKLYHNAPTSNDSMHEFANGELVTGTVWTNNHPSSGIVRENLHDYTSAFSSMGWYHAISDFSSKEIEVDGSNCGLFQFRLWVDQIDDTTSAGLFNTSHLYFVGARLQWIWA